MSRMLAKVKRVSSVTPKVLKDLGRVQRRGGVAMLIDCTGAVDRMGAAGLRRYGVNPSELLVSMPGTDRQAREIETRVRHYVEKMAVAGCRRARS